MTVGALCLSLLAPAAGAKSERAAFSFSTEFYGPLGYANPDAALTLRNGMANMVALWPPADAGMQRFVMNRDVRLNFLLQAATHVRRDSPASIESQRLAAAGICTAQPARGHLWSLMIEWDQSGGAWVPEAAPAINHIHFTGTGTRFLKDTGLKAINDLFARSFR